MKEPEVRKSELLDAAQKLFVEQGYAKTTVTDILDVHGLSKGVFYYYFKSKEEVMDAIIMRIVSADVAAAKEIADNPDLPAIPKLFQILFAQKPQNIAGKEEIIGQLHHSGNAEMHQKSLVQSILQLTPVLTRVIEQGIREKVMATEYPGETVEFLFASAQIVFDEGLFHWEAEQALRKAQAFIGIMESALGAEKGSFDEMIELLFP
jgi:AcrR family transcriptional regulator